MSKSTAVPVAYIRKSRVTTDRTVSWEVQEAAILEAAKRHGDTAPMILSDWNRSGRGTNGRPGYHQLRELVAAGRVSAIYSYTLSRLSRSLADFTSLVELCVDHGVSIRFAAEPSLNVETASATSTLLRNVMASFAQFDADISSERARDAVAVRRARGDKIGPGAYGERPGEDVDAVVAAYREAGSVLGAARLLNDRGVITRMGGRWSTTPVRDVLLRAGAMRLRSRSGLKAEAPFYAFQLLRCHCGSTLTGSRYRNGPDPAYVTYKCTRGRALSGHGKGSITERSILPWLKAESARLVTPERVEIFADQAAKRSALENRRARVLDMYDAGDINRDQYRDRMAVVDTAIDALADELTVVDIPALDWSWDPKDVNRVLRAMWSHVVLDDQLLPVEAVWRVPEWRA
ncbi:MAG: site-specific recombinase [Chloroflexota bacterium]|jgi:DNA invertase Pin-like site-specific DNA recombinase|nr:site-specific recombinase [Chloroflexota bacterium]